MKIKKKNRIFFITTNMNNSIDYGYDQLHTTSILLFSPLPALPYFSLVFIHQPSGISPLYMQNKTVHSNFNSKTEVRKVYI